jgi:hypothetical protein
LIEETSQVKLERESEKKMHSYSDEVRSDGFRGRHWSFKKNSDRIYNSLVGRQRR